MGNARSLLKAEVTENPDRQIFVEYSGFQRVRKNDYSVFTLTVSYMRQRWTIEKRFREISKLDKLLERKYEQDMETVLRPHSHFRNIFRGQDNNFLINRGREFAAYIQTIADNKTLFSSAEVQEFLEIGPTSLHPEVGRKGKEGYVRVCSGGYTVKHSSKPDFLRSWKWRWVALNDAQISIFDSRDGVLLASVIIDQGLDISCAGKIVIIRNNSRKLSFMTSNERYANEWVLSAKAFYATTPRALPQPAGSSYPIRKFIDSRVYTNSRDYYMNVALSILRATETIFIAAYMLNPNIIVTRPPLPAIRLDQLIKLKADQGVHIFISLNKESGSSQSHRFFKSEQTKRQLMALSSNIEVIRHPDASKNTWCHNENIVIVDRNVAYVSCVEFNYGDYDDMNHSVDDETGCRFPGVDYVQPHPEMHQPVRSPRNTASSTIPAAGSIIATVPGGLDDSSSGRFLSEAQPRHHQSFFTSPSALIDDDDDATIVEPESQREREARIAAEWDDYAMDTSSSGYPTFTSTHQQPVTTINLTAPPSISPPTASSAISENPHAEVPEPKEEGMLSSLFKNVEKHFTRAMADFEEFIGDGKDSNADYALMYPRQPVHSVHVAVSGQAARDIGSHFIQRWNHSRLMKWDLDRTHVSDVTDIIDYCVCPRCGATSLDENLMTCPSCGMGLGPKAKFLEHNDYIHPNPMFSPALPSTFTYIMFKCEFMGQLGFSLSGDGPVLVERLLKVTAGHGLVCEGTLLSSQGPNKELLLASSRLRATLGDIIVSIDGITVTHLNTIELTQFIRQRKEFLSQQHGTVLTPMTVLFRRHYIEELHNLPSVIETDSALYPVAEFEILNPPEAAAVTLLRHSEVLPMSSQAALTIGAGSTASDIWTSDPYADIVSATAPGIAEEPNGADASGMALALMNAMETTMPVDHHAVAAVRPVPATSTSHLVQQNSSVDRPLYAFSGSLSTPAVSAVTPVVTVPPAYEDVESTPTNINAAPAQPAAIVAETNGGEAITDTVEGISFPEVPTGRVVASTTEDYLSRYDLMPLAPSRPVQITNDGPVTGRREVERRAMALSGKGQLFRTVPFDPNARGATQPQPSNNGFTEVRTSTSNITGSQQRVQLDEGTNISYEAPISIDSAVASAFSHTEPVPAAAAPEFTIPSAASSSPIFNAPPPPYDVTAAQHSSHDIDKSSYPVLPPLPVAATAFNSNFHSYGGVPYSNEGSQQPNPFLQNVVPVAVGATDADVRQILHQNNQRPSVDPSRLSKGKRRSLELETRLAMSQLFHGRVYSNAIVSSDSRLGNCHVQVLRSSSLWSIGTKTETSIQQGWVDAIEEAQRFIYIESSAFTGGPMSGSDIKNQVIKALLDKLVERAVAKQRFRVVVILSLNGHGNFAKSEASRVNIQRQYMALCRGPSSLLHQFMSRVPGVDPSEYISFFSLRNWGVMNNRVVSNQIAVKSNIIIVDDRVMIIGSAGICDRSLLGERNSEVALRIEDTTHLDVQFAGATWSVGFLPHTTRAELMRHHLCLPEADVSDPLSDATYMKLLRGFAAVNSGIYDEIDGDISVYRCRSIRSFCSALAAKENKSYLDMRVRDVTASIKGFLVFFPLDFLTDSLPFVNNPVSSSGVNMQNLWV